MKKIELKLEIEFQWTCYLWNICLQKTRTTHTTLWLYWKKQRKEEKNVDSNGLTETSCNNHSLSRIKTNWLSDNLINRIQPGFKLFPLLSQYELVVSCILYSIHTLHIICSFRPKSLVNVLVCFFTNDRRKKWNFNES